MKEVRYRVWFHGEPAKRLRSFNDKEQARAWAETNQPDRGYELWLRPPTVTRRLLARLRRGTASQ